MPQAAAAASSNPSGSLSALRSPVTRTFRSDAALTATRTRTAPLTSHSIASTHHAASSTPSRYTQELAILNAQTSQPHMTGPVHLSLRGSKNVQYPKALPTAGAITVGAANDSSSSSSSQPTIGASSNPNARSLGRHEFRHAAITTPKEWMGERSEMMKTTQDLEYKDPRERKRGDESTAGFGSNWSTALGESETWTPSVSDLSNAPTPLQSLFARRALSAKRAAHELQRKQEREQREIDKVFEASAKMRYERAVEEQKTERESNTSAFFLDANDRASSAQQHERRSTSSAPSGQIKLGVQAGLSSVRYRDWATDSSLRLVAPNVVRQNHDRFAATFERVMSNEPGVSRSEYKSVTADALDSGLHSNHASGRHGFVPHFLQGVHPSLHSNVRRAIFMNGNEFFDTITKSSKFKQHKFQPRAYDKETSSGSGNGSGSRSGQEETNTQQASD